MRLSELMGLKRPEDPWSKKLTLQALSEWFAEWFNPFEWMDFARETHEKVLITYHAANMLILHDYSELERLLRDLTTFVEGIGKGIKILRARGVEVDDADLEVMKEVVRKKVRRALSSIERAMEGWR